MGSTNTRVRSRPLCHSVVAAVSARTVASPAVHGSSRSPGRSRAAAAIQKIASTVSAQPSAAATRPKRVNSKAHT